MVDFHHTRQKVMESTKSKKKEVARKTEELKNHGHISVHLSCKFGHF